MGFLFALPQSVVSLFALSTTRGGFVDVQTATAGGVTTLNYASKVPLFVALGCIAVCVGGWFLSTKRLTRHVGWILMVGGVIVFFLTVPMWLQERITYDDTQVTRVMSRWFLPHTVKFLWEDVDKIVVTDVTPNTYKKDNKTYVEFIEKDGNIVDWGNVSRSPLVGEVIASILKTARERGIPVETSTVKKRE